MNPATATSLAEVDREHCSKRPAHDDSSKQRTTFTSRMASKAVLASLAKLQKGHLTIVDGHRNEVFGNHHERDLRSTLTVHDPQFYRRVLFGGSLGAAESFIEGEWSCDDLTTLIRIFAVNLEASTQMGRGPARIREWAARLSHAFRANTRRGSQQNIHEHYDLGNDFFSLFLDKTMMYSSALFEQAETSLVEASVAKMERICKKLQLKPTDHLLEIGTGWGGFAEHAVCQYGCRVTTTTISKEQYDYSRKRFDAAGLSDRITVLLRDYRDLEGEFDKLVSIEMIEAVGHKYYGTFFETCGKLLRPDGVMLLQGITMPEQRYDEYLRSVDFIQQYIFPGGCLPSVLAMNLAIASNTEMRVVHLEDFAPHYARTLNCWRNAFFAKVDQVRELGFSEQFIRTWEYYFCYCEAAFLERATGVVQMLLAKPENRMDTMECI